MKTDANLLCIVKKKKRCTPGKNRCHIMFNLRIQVTHPIAIQDAGIANLVYQALRSTITPELHAINFKKCVKNETVKGLLIL